MVSIASNKNDNISFLASKSIADASKNVQLAISKLILTEYSSAWDLSLSLICGFNLSYNIFILSFSVRI